MAAEGASHTNYELDPLSLIPFVPPYWYPHLHPREPGKYCYKHDICEEVEDDLKRLKGKEDKESMLPNPNPSTSPSPTMAEELSHSHKKKADEVMMEDLDYKNKKMKILEEEEDVEGKNVVEKTPEEVEWTLMMKRLDEVLDQFIHKQKTTWLIKKGDNHDVLKLLSSPTRDFLIKSGQNHMQQQQQHEVKIEQLRDKHVVLYFACLSHSQGFVKCLHHEDLEEVYFSHQGQLEVVLVALGNDHEDIFHPTFSKMPWLTIPYEDKQARQDLQVKFAIPQDSLARTVMFAPDGTVLAVNSSIFCTYGPEGFPFTEDKLDDVDLDDQELMKSLYRKKLSLTELFGDSITTCEGKEVSTSKLEGKTVGLYFYEESYSGIERTRKLKRIWESLECRPDIDFEIVLNFGLTLNPSSAKAEFKEEFGNIPWHTLLGSGRKLCRVLKTAVLSRTEVPREAGYLIILEPDRSLNYFALDIYNVLGLDAYPFSLENAVKFMTGYLERILVLDKLLSPYAPLRRGCNSCSEYSSCIRCSTCSGKGDIVVSDLLGKYVLLLFATHSSYASGNFLRELKKIYSASLEAENCFEIIYISLDCDKSRYSFPNCIHEMPWLIHSFVPDFSTSLLEQVFLFEYPNTPLPAIAAFGRSGQLLAKESNIAFKEKWSSNYPFVDSYSCEEEVRREFVSNYKCDMELIFPGISSTK